MNKSAVIELVNGSAGADQFRLAQRRAEFFPAAAAAPHVSGWQWRRNSAAEGSSKKARERKYQGTKGPGCESSRERIGQGPIGTFAMGSELARERKGCESVWGVGVVCEVPPPQNFFRYFVWKNAFWCTFHGGISVIS